MNYRQEFGAVAQQLLTDSFTWHTHINYIKTRVEKSQIPYMYTKGSHDLLLLWKGVTRKKSVF